MPFSHLATIVNSTTLHFGARYFAFGNECPNAALWQASCIAVHAVVEASGADTPFAAEVPIVPRASSYGVCLDGSSMMTTTKSAVRDMWLGLPFVVNI